MAEGFSLEKWEWSEADFEQMGWHDCPIYAMRFDDDIYFDIDYIFKWIENGPGLSFTFWIAPATLIFKKPAYLKIDVELDFINGLEIADIFKEADENGNTIWAIKTQEGNVFIKAETYKQIIRRPPSFQFQLAILDDERGGISFSTNSEKNYQPADEILERKKNARRLFNLKAESKVLKANLSNLNRDALGTKSFLVEKRKIEEQLLKIEQLLLDSQ